MPPGGADDPGGRHDSAAGAGPSKGGQQVLLRDGQLLLLGAGRQPCSTMAARSTSHGVPVIGGRS